MIYSCKFLSKYLPKPIVKMIHAKAFPGTFEYYASKIPREAIFALRFGVPTIKLLKATKKSPKTEEFNFHFERILDSGLRNDDIWAKETETNKHSLDSGFTISDQLTILDFGEDFAIRAYSIAKSLKGITYLYLRQMIILDYNVLLTYIVAEKLFDREVNKLVKCAVIYRRDWMLDYLKSCGYKTKMVLYATIQSLDYWPISRRFVIINATMLGDIELLKHLNAQPDLDFDKVLVPVFKGKKKLSKKLAKRRFRALLKEFDLHCLKVFEFFLPTITTKIRK